MRIDCHVHTEACRHASGSVSQMVDAAVLAGVDVLAVTDHLPLPPGYDRSYAMPADRLERYVAEVLLQKQRSDVEVLLGIEADWIPGRERQLADVLSAYPFDVVIGSVHFLDGWAFDDPALLSGWSSRDVDEVWREYFETLAAAAASGLFDVMAHPDLVKKFRHEPSFDPLPLYSSAAAAFRSAGVAVEVSTAGLRKPVGDIYPALDFLVQCRSRGVRATTGSDAHCPGEVGYRLDDATARLIEAGYTELTAFKARAPSVYPIRQG